MAHLIAGRVNEVMYPISENCKTGNELRGAGERHGSDTSGSPVFGLHKATFVDLPCKDNYCSMLPGFTEEKVAQSAKLWFNVEAQTSEAISLSKRKPSKLKRCSRSDQSKSSCPNSTLKTIVNVKVESSDHNDVLDSRCVAVGKFNFSPSSLKREEEVQNDVFEDNLDHMLLRERMNMLTTHAGSSSDFDWLSTALPASEKIHAVLESVKPISIKCPRKRRKTVT